MSAREVWLPAPPILSVVYNNLGVDPTAPLIGAEVEYRVISGGGSSSPPTVTHTDFRGQVTSIQYTDFDGLEITVRTVNPEISVYDSDRGTGFVVGRYSGPCVAVRIDANPEPAHLFTNLRLTIAESDRTFQSRSKRVLAKWSNVEANAYHHDKYYFNAIEKGYINVQTSRLWGPDGAFVAAHEWGHMFHDKDLGGVIRYYSSACPSYHPPENRTTLECALAEGFADYYAVAVRTYATGSWVGALENGYHYETSNPSRDGSMDGSILEGAVASLLYDLTDSGAGSYSESWDNVTVSHQYVANAVRTCSTFYNRGDGQWWYLNHGIDHLIYCMEGRQPYRVQMSNGSVQAFFTTRPLARQPTQATSVQYGGQSLYYSQDFRKLWMVNLYRKYQNVGTNPQFLLEPMPETMGGAGE